MDRASSPQPEAASPLTIHELCRFLLAQGLLSPRDLHDEHFRIQEIARRNRNYKVMRRDGVAYFVKQGSDADGRRTVGYEAVMQQFLCAAWNSHDGEPDERRTPPLARCYVYDRRLGVLVTELQRDARDLGHHSRRAARFSSMLAADVGRSLRHLHRIAAPAEAMLRPDRAPPGILQIHRPGVEHYVRMSGGAQALTVIVQNAPELARHLDRLHAHWRADRLIHGDLKWDNCLVLPRRSRSHARVMLVDWEFARFGDVAWDVGSMFANYLSWWLASFSCFAENASAESLAGAAFPLERMQPAIRAFWQAYRAGRDNMAEGLLLRAVECAAARLVQTSYEAAQHTLLSAVIERSPPVCREFWCVWGSAIGLGAGVRFETSSSA